jgi:GTP cyclohydrolase III
MSKIRNRERVQELQSQLINEIKTFIPKSGELVFRTSFTVLIQMDYDDHYETEKILIYSLLMSKPYRLLGSISAELENFSLTSRFLNI